MPEITAVTRKYYDILAHFHENEWEHIFQALEEGTRQLFSIEEEGQIYGYVTLNFTPKYSLYKRLSIPEIQDLYIAPKYRRKGYAGLLISHCECMAKEQSATHIGISVSVSAEFAVAQKMYIARGYNVDGNGVTYDRAPVTTGQQYPVDDNLCLMLIKEL